MPNILYDALLAPHLGQHTEFLTTPDGQSYTHGGFLDLASQMAHALTSMGLTAGDRLAVQVEKSPQALALYAAAVQSGIVFLPLNTAYTVDELTYFIQDSGAAMVICDPKRQDQIAEIAAAQHAHVLTLDGNGDGSLMTLTERQDKTFTPVDRSGDDLAALLYTSGTTGRSKGAMLSHDNLLSNAKALIDTWQFTDQDHLIHALPIFHTHGLFVASNVSLLAGCRMTFMARFDLDAVITAIPQATSMMGVPTFYTRLLDDPRLTRELTQKMRLFISGSAPLLAETHVEFEHRTGHRILERYGMTETNMNTSNPYDGDRRAGTVGFPLDGVALRISDPETGAPLPQGEIGSIEVKGPNVFSGYWNMPEKTAEEFRQDGFFITGDLGVIDQDGYVSIVGRNKDLIISGGYNIYPKEIELILDQQPGVNESAVIGVPHADFGETVVGIITANQGEKPDLDAMMINVKASLARFKHPQKLVLIEELPRNSMGKVQKNVLRDTFKSILDE